MGAKPLFVAAALAAAFAIPLAPGVGAEETDECIPYPVGFCGQYDRQNVVFCYTMVNGLYVSASDDSAVKLGHPEVRVAGVGGLTADHVQPEKWVGYLRTAPTEAFANDPWNQPLPRQSVWQETNIAPGLQVKKATCAQFQWWAECDSWMGPYLPVEVGPDKWVF
jgi:hypothetical protein